MSLAEAIAAVRAGMAYSTSMPPGDQQPPVSMEPGPEGEDPYGAPDVGTGAPTFRKAPDGSVYQWSGAAWEPAPDWAQAPEPMIPAIATPSGPENRARGIYPQGAVPGAEAFQPAPLMSPEGASRVGLDYGSLASIQALKEAGLLTTDEASDLLFGRAGGGGGITALQAEQLKRQAEQDKWNKVVDYITALQNERQMAEAAQRARTNTLLAAGPDLAAGNEYRGGFGPSGGYSIMERLQGGAGLPVATGPSIVPLDLGPMPADPGLVDRLLGPLAGVA